MFPLEGPVPPSPDQPAGAAAESIRRAETALARQNSVTANVDLQVVTAVLNAHAAHETGADALRALQREIEAAIATRTDLDTPAGARDFQRYLIDKLHDIRAVVDDTNLDDTSKAALAAALASLYSTSGMPEESASAGSAGSSGAAPAPSPPPVPAHSGLRTSAPVDLGLDDPGLDGWGLDSTGAPDPGMGGPDVSGAGTASPAVAPPVAPSPAPAAMPSFGGAPSLPSLGGLSPLAPLSNLAAGLTPDRPFAEDGRTDGPAPPDPVDDPAAEADPPMRDAPASQPSEVELSGVIAAAVSGTPIPDAFAAHGISVPDPGSPVSAPLEPTQVIAGDVGIFTDRHALALGNGKVLLDNQIQPIETVSRPGFIGWQHPSAPQVPTPPDNTPPDNTRPDNTAPAPPVAPAK